MSEEPRRLNVALGARSYDIVIGHGLLGRAGDLAGDLLAGRKAVIVTDTTVGPLHGEALERSLEAAGVAHERVTVAAGEGSKALASFEALCEELLARGVERSTVLIALGGGVIGDLTGFAAAVLLRGLDFIQVPTTLLAQVDSSVGGKTGVNSKHGKNLIGAFHQPRLVLADSEVLHSLPRRERLAGYAEVVKYGLIDQPEFFAWLEGHGADLLDGDQELLSKAVETSCAAKAAIVAEDEREAGRRALLNLGHTFGHALEAECGYGDELLHGEAVAIGMVMAFELSVELGLCPPEDADRLHRHLAAVGLPTGLEHLPGRVWDPATLLAHMGKDKKVSGGKLTFILARGIGQAFITREVEEAAVLALLTHHAAAAA